jgi:hypothetical protein
MAITANPFLPGASMTLAETTTTADGDAATYDAWFKAQVQQAIDDPRPGIPADAARAHFAARREAWRLLGERLELLTRGDDNVVTLKRRNKSAEPLTA